MSVLIADDNLVIRKALRACFESQEHFVISAEAINGRDAIDKAKQFRPDLIILDFSMPIMDGIKAATVLNQLLPSTVLILFTIHSNSVIEVAAKKAGIVKVGAKENGLLELVRQAESFYRKSSMSRKKGNQIFEGPS